MVIQLQNTIHGMWGRRGGKICWSCWGHRWGGLSGSQGCFYLGICFCIFTFVSQKAPDSSSAPSSTRLCDLPIPPAALMASFPSAFSISSCLALPIRRCCIFSVMVLLKYLFKGPSFCPKDLSYSIPIQQHFLCLLTIHKTFSFLLLLLFPFFLRSGLCNVCSADCGCLCVYVTLHDLSFWLHTFWTFKTFHLDVEYKLEQYPSTTKSLKNRELDKRSRGC